MPRGLGECCCHSHNSPLLSANWILILSLSLCPMWTWGPEVPSLTSCPPYLLLLACLFPNHLCCIPRLILPWAVGLWGCLKILTLVSSLNLGPGHRLSWSIQDGSPSSPALCPVLCPLLLAWLCLLSFWVWRWKKSLLTILHPVRIEPIWKWNLAERLSQWARALI